MTTSVSPADTGTSEISIVSPQVFQFTRPRTVMESAEAEVTVSRGTLCTEASIHARAVEISAGNVKLELLRAPLDITRG